MMSAFNHQVFLCRNNLDRQIAQTLEDVRLQFEMRRAKESQQEVCQFMSDTPTAPFQWPDIPTHPQLPSSDQAPQYRVLQVIVNRFIWDISFLQLIHLFSIFTLIYLKFLTDISNVFVFWDMKVWLYLIFVSSFHILSFLFIPSPFSII